MHSGSTPPPLVCIADDEGQILDMLERV